MLLKRDIPNWKLSSFLKFKAPWQCVNIKLSFSPTVMRIATPDDEPWPWMVSLGYLTPDRMWRHFCGGSLIHAKFILTAAHCLVGSSMDSKVVLARMGYSDLMNDKGEERLLLETFVHPRYQPPKVYFDVALVKIEEVKFSFGIQPVCLPDPVLDPDQGLEFAAIITGWGFYNASMVASSVLRYGRVQIFNYKFCNFTVRRLTASAATFLPDLYQSNVLCAGNTMEKLDSCKGDSGGPLVIHDKDESKFIQMGIVSANLDADYCGNQLTPTVYTRLDNLEVRGFITSQLFGTDRSDAVSSTDFEAVLLNNEHKEALVSRAQDSFKHSPFLRQVFTDRTKEDLDEPAKVWKFLAVPGLKNTFRIQNKATGEFLVASSDYSSFDGLRRRVLCVISDYPQLFSGDPTGHWELIRSEFGTVFKNSHYNEFLYAAASNLALDSERRSVFTWKMFSSLGPNGDWIFKNQSYLRKEEGRHLTPGKYLITNYLRKELLKASPTHDFGQTERRVFTDRSTESSQPSDPWIVIKISASDFCYKIQDSKSGDYLWADFDQSTPETSRRRVYLMSLKSGKPTMCSGADDWNIIKHSNGYLIQNRKYSDFFYAAPERLADGNRRQVFTWSTLYNLGSRGIWLFDQIE